MSPFVVLYNTLPIFARILCMQRVQRALRWFKLFHFVFLLHHCHQQTSHQFNTTLFQFIGFGSVFVLISDFLVSHWQSPYGKDAINVVSNLKQSVQLVQFIAKVCTSTKNVCKEEHQQTHACGLFGEAGNSPVTGCWCVIINRWTIRW